MRVSWCVAIVACQAALLCSLRTGMTQDQPAAELTAADSMQSSAVASEASEAQAAAAGEAPQLDLHPSAATELPALQSGQLQPAVGSSPPAANSRLVRLAKDYDLWIDPQRKLVIVDGRVCLREGQLEMFACPAGTKEHESIVAVNCRAQFVHAALLAVGAEPGTPVQFSPEYAPATGSVVDVLILWVDEQGQRHKQRAQEWIKNVKTDKTMDDDWVFAGSGFWTDEQDGQRYYYADGGDFICVSNFATAMLDVPVQSTQDTAELLFTAFTERIPPLGTKVRLVLVPRPGEPAQPAPSASTQPASPASAEQAPQPTAQP